MKRFALAMAFTLLLGMPAASNAQQLGLRMDAATSMQWSGSLIFIEANGHSILETSAKEIREIWMGPVPGSYGIWTNTGVGMLLGNDVAVGGTLLGGDLTLRSSRFDAIWALRPKGSTSEIVQVLAGNLGRVVLKIEQQVVDFDVDRAGRIVYLLPNGSAVFATASDKRVTFDIPTDIKQPKRIFVDGESSEIAVYGSGRLARFDVKAGSWTVDPVDEKTDALVRQAKTRKIAVEPRFP
jgi:hypothetical protein